MLQGTEADLAERASPLEFQPAEQAVEAEAVHAWVDGRPLLVAHIVCQA